MEVEAEGSDVDDWVGASRVAGIAARQDAEADIVDDWVSASRGAAIVARQDAEADIEDDWAAASRDAADAVGLQPPAEEQADAVPDVVALQAVAGGSCSSHAPLRHRRGEVPSPTSGLGRLAIVMYAEKAIGDPMTLLASSKQHAQTCKIQHQHWRDYLCATAFTGYTVRDHI